MSEKEILQIIVTLPWVIFLSITGGFVAFIRRLNNATEPQPLGKIFLKLTGELVISGFVGLVTFLLCQDFELSANQTAISVAISGHLGGNAIDQITKLSKIFSNTVDNKESKNGD
ncbi:phage holin family protein [Faucicola mancuniensis]|uniref:phage holin family protein n=1 Tax=Faucicola mancuniensis TaxID=1309795 RepID=UPI003977BE01